MLSRDFFFLTSGHIFTTCYDDHEMLPIFSQIFKIFFFETEQIYMYMCYFSQISRENNVIKSLRKSRSFTMVRPLSTGYCTSMHPSLCNRYNN